MEVYWNRKAEPFIFVESNGNGRAVFITPTCHVKTLKLDKFSRYENFDEDDGISKNLIGPRQIERYREEESNRIDLEEIQKRSKRLQKFEALPIEERIRFVQEKLTTEGWKRFLDEMESVSE